MIQYEKYKFSITIHTDDLAVVNCLRALSKYSQKKGNNIIPWAGMTDEKWLDAGNKVTFRFTSEEYRQIFVDEINRLLPNALWQKCSTSDNDPAKPSK